MDTMRRGFLTFLFFSSRHTYIQNLFLDKQQQANQLPSDEAVDLIVCLYLFIYLHLYIALLGKK